MNNPISIRLEAKEAIKLRTLLEYLTYDDVATMLERSHEKSSELSEHAYNVWSAADDLYALLLAAGVEMETVPEKLNNA